MDSKSLARMDAWIEFYWLMSLPRRWKLIYRALLMPRYIATARENWRGRSEEFILDRALKNCKLTYAEYIEGVTEDENRHNRMYQELPLCCYHWIKGREPICGGTCELCVSETGMACPPVCRKYDTK